MEFLACRNASVALGRSELKDEYTLRMPTSFSLSWGNVSFDRKRIMMKSTVSFNYFVLAYKDKYPTQNLYS